MTPEQIRQRGMEALNKALGPVGTMRFIRLFDMGWGDYTRDRHQWLGDVTDEEILADIKELRQQESP